MSNAFDFGNTNVALALDVEFPSNVNPGPGIAIDKTGATWTVGLGYPPLGENTFVSPTSNYYLAVYNVALTQYQKVRLDNLIASATGLDTRTPMGDADYIATSTDRYIGVATPLTLNRTLSLPASSSVPGGREIVLQDEIGTCTSSHYIVVRVTGTDTIDGKAQRILSTPYGGLRFRSNGSNAWNVVATTSLTPVSDSNYTCNPDDKVIAYTALTAARTVTLPLAANYPPGQRLTVMDQVGACTATITLTVLPQGSDTINGLANSGALNTAHAFFGFASDGVSRWTIVDNVGGGGGTTVTSSQITDASPLGRLLLTQATAALDRTSLGSGVTGDAMFLASTQANGRAVLGSGTVGDPLFTSNTQAAAQSTLGLGTMATQNANNVNITGGSITGVSGISGGGVTVSDTPPGSPTVGTLWYDSTAAQLYVWFNDGTSSQWVIATNQNLSGIYLPLTGGTVTGPVTMSAGATVTSLNGGPLAGQRNRIINGDMRIDQRNGGAAINAAGNSTFAVDRWLHQCIPAGKFNIGQNLGAVAPPAGFAYYLGAQVGTAYTVTASDWMAFTTSVEGLNISDLGWGKAGAQAVTLSFQVRSSVTGTHSGALNNGAVNRSYPFTFSVPTANVWTPISITVPGDTAGTWAVDNSAGMYLFFCLGSGATNRSPAGAWISTLAVGANGAVNVVATVGATFQITGVQLEPGSTATPFERRHIGTELALCQRYYQFLGGPPASMQMIGYGLAGGQFAQTLTFSPMRIAPTAAVLGTWTLTNAAVASMTASPNSLAIQLNVTGTGQASYYNNTANSGITLSAEL